MTEEFRDRMHREWRARQFWEAAEAERRAGDALQRYLFEHYELRPPCRNCGQWPCECRN